MHGHRIAGALFAAVFLSAPIGTCFAQSRVVDRLQKDYVNCITDIPLPVNAQRQHFGSVWDALEATNHSLESHSVVEAVAAAALADYGYKMSHLGTCKRKHDALSKALATLDAGEQQAVTESINEDTWSLVKVT